MKDNVPPIGSHRKAPTDKGLSQPLPVPFEVGIPGEVRLPLDGDEAFEVWLNGKGPFRFALDSGAVDLLKSTVAAKLGLAIEGSRSARGVTNQTVTSGYVNVDRVAVGSAIESHRPFLVLDLPAPVDGLLGFETLRRLPVTLDYAARTLTVTPSTAEPKACDVVVPFAFDGRTPLVDGSLNTVPAQFWIDSGNDDSAIVFDRFNCGSPRCAFSNRNFGRRPSGRRRRKLPRFTAGECNAGQPGIPQSSGKASARTIQRGHRRESRLRPAASLSGEFRLRQPAPHLPPHLLAALVERLTRHCDRHRRRARPRG